MSFVLLPFLFWSALVLSCPDLMLCFICSYYLYVLACSCSCLVASFLFVVLFVFRFDCVVVFVLPAIRIPCVVVLLGVVRFCVVVVC